ncbi:hypothetical protein BASA81_000460 [Batrachochytrium salamandrivorans]|nr:hypothetical protein BASA81_000460 [Batrachochytrium salamandrivorans]
MSQYEQFKPANESLPAVSLLWNEPASEEVETWQRMCQSVPLGVLKRKFDEQAAAAAEEELKACPVDNTSMCASNSVESELKKHWMPDNVCRVCYRCELPFSLFRRRHHCRVCGLVFCGDCAGNYVNGAPLGFSQFVRACDECHEQQTGAIHLPPNGNNNNNNSSSVEDLTSVNNNPPSVEDLQRLVIVDEDNLEVVIAENAASKPTTPKFVKPPEGQQQEHSFGYPKVSERTKLAFDAREQMLLDAIVHYNPKLRVSEWTTVLIELAQGVCDTVVPNHGDAVSVLDYVYMQLLPGKSPQNSRKVNGAMLTKNLLHKNMPRQLARPRIMLLESGLELNRGAKQRGLVSFEKLIEQERLYLELVVRKICSVQIDLLLCGGTISPIALELLLERNIAVASTVTLTDLKWIARLTGASIIPTTESINRLLDPTGTCQLWRMESIAMEDNGKQVWDTFMFFENTPQSGRGCTILLRGGKSFTELEQIASEFKSLVLQLWTIKLDHAFVACVDGAIKGSLFGQYGKPVLEDLCALQTLGINATRIHQFEQKQRNTASNSHMVSFQFYHPRRDRTLEEFLLSAFKKQNYTLLYVHGFGRMSFSPVERLARADVESMGFSANGKQVLTWANCVQCGLQTSVCLVHPLVLHMSFGRFLQNGFYMQGLQGQRCAHSSLHDYARYFCLGELMLSMSFETSAPLEIRFPSQALDMNNSVWYDSFSHTLWEELQEVGEQVVAHFASTSCASTASKRMEEILAKLSALAVLPAPNEMNIVYRDLFLQCMEWNVWIQSDNGVNKPIILPPLPHVIASTSSPRRASFRSRYYSNNAVLSRRPSLMEIQTARERIMEPPPPLSPLPLGKPSRSVSALSTSTTVDSSRTPPAPLRIAAAVARSSVYSYRKNLALNKTLPPRLVEGHLLLPPGRRLGNAVVPVLEDEPSSWIAHALCSNHYSEKLQALLRLELPPSPRPVLSPASSSEMVLTADEELFHIRSGFSDASEYSPRQCAFSVLSYFAAQFHQLRVLYMRKGGGTAVDVEEEFLEKRFIDSLSRCATWRPTGGKSTATFLKTLDGRFIVKSITQKELDTFAEIALQYFDHLSKSECHSLLVPFLGMYSLTMQSEVVSGKRPLAKHQLGNVQSSTLLVAVMPNIFFNVSPSLVYDLKGNAPNKSRFVKNPAPGSVRLDWNFCQDNGGVPLALHPNAKDAFTRAVQYDALFLASVGVVDYSLLVGVHSTQVAVGIIDYLQVYTIQKMLESTVKKFGQADPTVVSPNKYQARFVNAMEKYFASCGKFSFSPNTTGGQSSGNSSSSSSSGSEGEEDLSATLVEQSILFQ